MSASGDLCRLVVADCASSSVCDMPRKSEMTGLLKQRMLNKQFFYPLLNWERLYRGDIYTELNVERYDLPGALMATFFGVLRWAVYLPSDRGPEPQGFYQVGGVLTVNSKKRTHQVFSIS
jgi:hypothetical protein